MEVFSSIGLGASQAARRERAGREWWQGAERGESGGEAQSGQGAVARHRAVGGRWILQSAPDAVLLN